MSIDARVRGAIDKVAINEDLLVSIIGWALLPDNRAAITLSAKIGDHFVETGSVTRRDRPDVVRHFPGADLHSGFSISFPLRALPILEAASTISVFAGETGHSTTPICPPTNWPADLAAAMLESRGAARPTQRKRSVDSELRLGIGAIFRNERPYILEWIAYHRVLGFKNFFIADNRSDDGSTEILDALSKIGIIDHIPFPGGSDKAPQLPAYNEIIQRHFDDVDWLALTDADEFFLPTDGEQSLVPFVTEINARREVGAVVFNWASYGSSGHVESSDDLVVERFRRRSERRYATNHHYKSLVRTSAAPKVRATPHLLGADPGFTSVQTSGASLVWHSERGEGLSANVIWDRVRLNHFAVKSRQEFRERKAPKGRVDVIGEFRGQSYFERHDRNEIYDPTPSWLVEATKAEMKRLGELLAGRNY